MNAGRRFDLVAFDMDGVLIGSNSTWVWIHRHFGVSNEEGLQEFLEGRIDDREFMRRDIALWRDKRSSLDIGYIEGILDSVPEVKGVGETIASLNGAGIRTVIISGGLDIVAESLARKYGFDDWAANGLEVDEKGILTGNGILRVELVNKGKTLEDFLQRWSIPGDRAAAVGNSFVDVSMFKGCGFSIAFNPIDTWVAENASTVVEGDDLGEILPLLLS